MEKIHASGAINQEHHADLPVLYPAKYSFQSLHDLQGGLSGTLYLFWLHKEQMKDKGDAYFVHGIFVGAAGETVGKLQVAGTLSVGVAESVILTCQVLSGTHDLGGALGSFMADWNWSNGNGTYEANIHFRSKPQEENPDPGRE